MKRIALMLLITASIQCVVNAQDSKFQLKHVHEKCGVMNVHNRLLETDPNYRLNREILEYKTQNFVRNARLSQSGGVVVIPVVFHVVYKTAAENISDDFIKAQIKQLNDDYRRINSDRSSTPSGFQERSDDIEVQFCLATRDPNGNATTGIMRYNNFTPATWDDATFDATVKPATIWDRDRYLNLWSANLGSTLLGYAQFPGGPSNTDGVVLSYETVGSLATRNTGAPFDAGRTATHEVGHWLNLFHIWGDDYSYCFGNDFVYDTPNQTTSTSGCKTYPATDVCSPSSSPGIMFSNYMDYSDDDCLNAFTTGQKDRILAAILNFRSSLLTSNACKPLGADYTVNVDDGSKTVCAGQNLTYSVLTTAENSYATTINLALSGVPAGATANLASNTVAPGGSVNVSVNVSFGMTPGFYSFWVKTTSGANNPDSIAITFKVNSGSLSASPTIIAPLNGVSAQSTTPEFRWQPVTSATNYDFDLSTTSNFSNIILSRSNLVNTYTFVPTTTPLSNTTTYYWRVRAKNNCATGSYASGSFTTGNITCRTITSTDIPKTISSTGRPLVTSTLTWSLGGTVTDVNVQSLTGTHTYISDLMFRLRSPANNGDPMLLFLPCGDEDNFNIGFDDQSEMEQSDIPCPPTDGQLYQANYYSPLSFFNGQAANGTWTLRLRDTFAGDGGSLTGWSLRLCVDGAVIPVELTKFSAKPLKKSIQLQWSTASERNNRGFAIERSLDPLSNFEEIGFVKGQNNGIVDANYSFEDTKVDLGKTYYYRLRQIDNDDKQTLSKIEAANLDENGIWGVSLQPNPAETAMVVDIYGKIKDDVVINVYSTDGRLVLTQKSFPETNQITLDLAPLSSGLYILKCQSANKTFSQKFVKK